MTHLRLIENEFFSPQVITDNMFGTNFVTSYDFEFIQSQSLLSSLRDLEVSILRFPGGSVTESIFADASFLTGDYCAEAWVDHEGQPIIITPISDFMRLAGSVGAGVRLVLPTRVAFDQSAGQALFAGTYGERRLVSENYFDAVRLYIDNAILEAGAAGTQISSIEIGNEFWGSGQMTAAEYGWLAGQIAKLIEVEYESLGILIQSAASANQYSPAQDRIVYLEADGAGDFIIHNQGSPGNHVDDSVVRAIMPGSGVASAQTALIAELVRDSLGATGNIDGVVGHVYFDSGLDGIDSQRDFALDRIPDIFSEAFGDPDLDFFVTEWSPRNPLWSDNDTNLGNVAGLQYAHTTIEAFFELVSHGVAGANFWPTTFGRVNNAQRVLIDSDSGDLSFGGIAFQWLAASVSGMQALLDQETTGQVDVHGFGNETGLTLFVAERSGTGLGPNNISLIDLELGSFAPEDGSIMWLSYLWSNDGSFDDDTATPVVRYSRDIYAAGSEVQVRLRPWEIVRIEFLPPDWEDSGVGIDGEIPLQPHTTSGAEIHGGRGNETIHGEPSNDIINGGGGNDTLFGLGGDDRLAGNGGDDASFGGEGDDVIIGDFGRDVLFGEAGNDTIRSWAGTDYLDGGTGDDLFIVSPSSSTMNGFYAANVGNQSQTGTGARIPLDQHHVFELYIEGGLGSDTLRMSDEAEALFLDDVYSDIHPDAVTFDSSGGREIPARFQGIEWIEARGGDDIIDLTSQNYLPGVEGLVIDGGSGSDTIWGSAGGELIVGGSGDDVIFGGSGRDTIYGGTGADTFEFSSTSTETRLLDFNYDEGDIIRIYQSGFSSIDERSLRFSEDGLVFDFYKFPHSSSTSFEIQFNWSLEYMSSGYLAEVISSVEFI